MASPAVLSASRPSASPEEAPGEGYPLRRAADAWLAIEVSPVIDTFAFLARGIELGGPPKGAGCAQHLLGPLVGCIVGPAAGPLPRDATEELYRRAADSRGIDARQWERWQRVRRTPHLLEDLTALLHGGVCAEGPGQLTCTCALSGASVRRRHQSLRPLPPGFGPIPALAPSGSSRSDPWHDALVAFVSTYRGRGTKPRSPFSSEGGSSVSDRRQLVRHLELLANVFAGPRRVDRMAGLAGVAWEPPISYRPQWAMHDLAIGGDDAADQLLNRLRRAVGV